jgi:hypothetical protein
MKKRFPSKKFHSPNEILLTFGVTDERLDSSFFTKEINPLETRKNPNAVYTNLQALWMIECDARGVLKCEHLMSALM